MCVRGLDRLRARLAALRGVDIGNWVGDVTDVNKESRMEAVVEQTQAGCCGSIVQVQLQIHGYLEARGVGTHLRTMALPILHVLIDNCVEGIHLTARAATSTRITILYLNHP